MNKMFIDDHRVGLSKVASLILLVEDDEDAASGIQLALEVENYRVVWVQDASAAMAWLTANEAPILIITDFKMKKNATTANGDALVEWTTLKGIRVLMISGMPEEAKAACKAKGLSVPIVAKPFSIEPFIDAIQRLINPREKDKLTVAN
jgi:DNA-binding NtrC family response regulator